MWPGSSKTRVVGGLDLALGCSRQSWVWLKYLCVLSVLISPWCLGLENSMATS